MGGKVLVPTQTMIRNLKSARLAADVMGVPTIILARTDANAANLITSDIDEYDKPFITGERTVEGFYKTRAGLDQAISRGLELNAGNDWGPAIGSKLSVPVRVFYTYTHTEFRSDFESSFSPWGKVQSGDELPPDGNSPDNEEDYTIPAISTLSKPD